MEALAAERDGKGAFKDLADFARRVDPRGLNKRQLESLIASGGFDALHPNRAGVHALAEAIMASAQVSIAHASVEEIDTLNILRASWLALTTQANRPAGPPSWPRSNTN